MQEKYSNFVPRPLSADDLILFGMKTYYLSKQIKISWQKQRGKIVWILEARIADKMDANFCRNKRAAYWKTFSTHARGKRDDPRDAGKSPAFYGSACDGKCHLKSNPGESCKDFLSFQFNSKLEDYIHRHRTAFDEVALAILEFKDEQVEMAEKGMTTFNLEDAEEKVYFSVDKKFIRFCRCITS